ncbi:MAG TPA: precorrin-6A synthase (deacetylating) [Aldersonia sp.]
MRKLFVIGIGVGDPDQVTVAAIKAMRAVDVFFVIGKGETKRELVEVRTRILREYVGEARIVEIPDPARDRTPADYAGVVDDWHDRRAALLTEQFALVDGVGGILVWGDPSLYDSTLRVVDRVLERVSFEVEVIPGITSVQALAARHRIVLNRVGEPVVMTTGRRLREAAPTDDAVVMLDSGTAFEDLDPATQIWWGAYLGMPDETLLAGTVGEVGERIRETRAALRERKGWIMDVYLLRPPQ